MIGRLYFAASTFFAVNLAATLGLPYANMFEKGLYLALAAAILMLRRVDWLAAVLLVFTTLMTAALGLMTTSLGFNWVTWFLSLNQFVILYILIGFVPTFRDAESILRISGFLPLICIFAGVIGGMAAGHELFGREYATGIARLQGALIPAFLSGIAMTGVIASLILALEWRRLPFLALAALNLVILLLAGGRAAFVVTLMVAAGLVGFSSVIHIRDKMVLALGSLIALPIIALIGLPFVFKRLLSSTDNGRDIMAEYLHSVIDQHPLTGIGFGHQYWETPRSIIVEVGSAAAHNDFLRLTVELGYIGAAIFYLTLSGLMLRSSLRSGKVNWTALIAFAGFLIFSLSDNALATPAYFPLLIVALLSNSQFAFRTAGQRGIRTVPTLQTGPVGGTLTR